MFRTVIEAISKTFVISSLVPAAFFTLLNQIFVLPLVSDRFHGIKMAWEQFSTLGGNLTLFLSATLLVAFSLASASPTIIKLYEGLFPFQRPLLGWRRNHHLKRFDRVYSTPAAEQLMHLRRDYPLTGDIRERRSFEAEIHRREEELLLERGAMEVVLWYPRSRKAVLPTRLGNILRASEDHGRVLYGLDPVLMWPRMLDLISHEHRAALDDARSSLEFLLNCSLLVWIFGVECSGIAVLTKCWVNLVWTAIMAIGGYLFYSAAIPVARVYAELVKSTIDRFRLSLLEAFGGPRNPPLEEERRLWQRFNRFLLFGNAFDYPASAQTRG